jgi:uncharacterized damage-inducible protein DinB
VRLLVHSQPISKSGFQGAIMRVFSSILLSLLFVVSKLAPAPSMPTASETLDFWISNTEKEVVSAAEAMPEEKYSFRPTAGEFTGVRTFGDQVKHLSAANYQLAALILGEKPAHDERGESAPESIKSKAQIMEYVKGSFAELHRAVRSIHEGNMLEAVGTSSGAQKENRLHYAVDAVAHSYDHYGQMVEYLRMNGIVPPASRK